MVCAGAGQRDLGRHGEALIVGEDGCHGGLNVARGDGVDRNGAAGKLTGERFGEADHAGF